MKALGLLKVLAAGSSLGQAFNIDLGPTGHAAPASSFGAAASQAGYWNPQFGLPTLTDTNGNATSALMSGFFPNPRSQSIPGASGGDALLMEDMAASTSSLGGSVEIGVTPLAIGQYKV